MGGGGCRDDDNRIITVTQMLAVTYLYWMGIDRAYNL